MIYKVQKIKEWISKAQDFLMDAQGNFEYPEHEGAYHILCNLDAYIDSLQEEPVSRTPADVASAMQEVEEKSRAYTEAHKGESSDEILAQMRGEELVSEGLEKVAIAYNKKVNFIVAGDIPNEHFMAGAKWQKEQMIDKACSFLHHYQEYPNHDIATDKLVEAFRMYIEL